MKINSSSDRRTFIKRAALLGGSALLAAFGTPKTAQPAADAPQPKTPGQGYRLTAHIKKYYETASQ